ncbi:hypothetical protein PMAYCL1PPCAC_29434 [Pristionchus mayeri]|uniref:Hydrolase n=1 Tax=Pristionchus mayeri TaxID=1317129 RepID=A0AAN5DA12_9BILA|nr:hypothetical protein PMAYCL1PPCAC_29434 [Pristionchus mayeri]
MQSYKAVVFDYGGVIMSYEKEVPAWKELEKEYNLAPRTIQTHLFRIFKHRPDLEKRLFEGRYTAEELEREELSEYLSEQIGVELPRPLPLLHRWMGPGSEIPFNDEMLLAVKILRSRGYHTSILTNNYIFDKAGLAERTPVDNSLFDLIVESTKEGVMKPERKIYEIIQSRLPSSISRHEIVFLDDNHHNIEAADDFGWATIEVNPYQIKPSIEKLEDLLNINLTSTSVVQLHEKEK